MPETPRGAWPRCCYFLGADLGQANDYTALVAVERVDTPHDLSSIKPVGRAFSTRLRICGIRRLPLGVPYPAQAAEIGATLRRLPAGWRRTELVVDRSGVGRPVFDIFVKAGLKPIGVTITAGEAETRADGGWRVSKAILVSEIAALLHKRELEIPKDHALAPVLARELQDFRLNFTATGTATFSAREGAHDDLVLAAAVACWRATRFDRDAITSREFLV